MFNRFEKKEGRVQEARGKERRTYKRLKALAMCPQLPQEIRRDQDQDRPKYGGQSSMKVHGERSKSRKEVIA